MKDLLAILTGLGVDYTLYIQLGLFLFVLLYLWFVTFTPYMKAYSERIQQTTGSQGEAEEISAKVRELESAYQRKARGLNTDIKSVFDKQRLEAQKEHERIIVDAKDRAKEILERARNQIQDEYNRAREELLKESPVIGQNIAARLLSKEH